MTRLGYQLGPQILMSKRMVEITIPWSRNEVMERDEEELYPPWTHERINMVVETQRICGIDRSSFWSLCGVSRTQGLQHPFQIEHYSRYHPHSLHCSIPMNAFCVKLSAVTRQ